MSIDWPEGSVGFFRNVSGAGSDFYAVTKHPSSCSGKPGFEGEKLDGGGYHVFSERWEWFERRAAWNGQGIPPIGIEIEVEHERYGWIGARVVGADGEAAIVRTNDGYAAAFESQRRPLRTPEQIEAEERKELEQQACRDIEELVASYNVTLSCSLAIRATVNSMLAKGYRKQEAP